MARPAWVVAAVGLAGLAAFPFLVGGYPVYVVEVWLVLSIAAIGLNIPVGLAGVLSFGQGAFMLIGAYATALGVGSLGLPAALAIPFSVVLATAVGAAIGLPSLRLTGLSLAVVTLTFSFVTYSLARGLDFTGGAQGLFMPPLALVTAYGGRLLYYVILAAFLLSALAYLSVSTGKTGRALRLLSANPIVARSIGINLLRANTLAFSLSAAFGALSGSLFGILTSYVAPETFSPELSVSIFAAVMIGGRATLAGPVLGAAFIVLIPELTQGTQHLGEVVWAALFTGVATLLPRGLVGLARWRRGAPAVPARG